MIETNLEDLGFSLEVKNIDDKTKETCDKLKEELENNEKLVCLSAPQINVKERIIALKFEDGIKFLINPLTLNTKDLTVSRETCISCGDQEYLIPRFKSVEFMYTKPNGQYDHLEFKDVAAFLYQQMNDMLDGLLLSDYGLPIDNDFDELTKEEQETIVKEYLKSFSEARDYIQSEINLDPKLRERQKTIEFITSVAKGETKLQTHKPNRETRRRLQKEAKALNKVMKKDAKLVQ